MNTHQPKATKKKKKKKNPPKETKRRERERDLLLTYEKNMD